MKNYNFEEHARSEAAAFLNVVPPSIRKLVETFLDPMMEQQDYPLLVEVRLDLGRPPRVVFADWNEIDLDAPNSEQADIAHVIKHIGKVNSDHRAGVNATMHRASVIMNAKDNPVGATIRYGRVIKDGGIFPLIKHVFDRGESVLIIGPPGSGKTTLLRPAAAHLAETYGSSVIVVDKSGEILGYGDIPHPSGGRARRLQVASPEQQYRTMLEAVQNHGPRFIFVDELGTRSEVEAAKSISKRGVKLVCTAHGGSLLDLVYNDELFALTGGRDHAAVTDELMLKNQTGKLVESRISKPVCNVCIELLAFDAVVIYPNVEEAVDKILRGKEGDIKVDFRSTRPEALKSKPNWSGITLKTVRDHWQPRALQDAA
jgi:stage III sporulation protein SpoIIIAA